jgi:hypothetical protein
MSSARIAFKPHVPSDKVASARLRCYLPVQYLRQAGWGCEIYQAERCEHYEVVVFQKAYSAEDRQLALRLRARGARVVLDLCDNHLFVPPDRPEFRGRADLLRAMIDACDDITVCTSELAKWVQRPTHVIDDALDEVSRGRRNLLSLFDRWRKSQLRLVWFGTAGMESPAFGLIDLARLLPELNALNTTLPLQLTVISNSREAYHKHLIGARFSVRYHEYKTRSFQRLFRRADVCLIPVTPNPFTLCKTLNRPALSLLLGVPVVADAIPSYEELRPFICVGGWREHLTRYAADSSLRQRHVEEGQRYLRCRYTAERVVSQWAAALEPALARKSA